MITAIELLESRHCEVTQTGAVAISRKYEVAHGAPDVVLQSFLAGEITISDSTPTMAGIQWLVGTVYPWPVGSLFDDCLLKSITPEPHDDAHCRVEVKWESMRQEGENAYGERWEWTLDAQTTHITSVGNSAQQTSYGKDAGVTIGVDGDNVNGVDVYRPCMKIKATKRVAALSLETAKTAIQAALNTVGLGAFAGYLGQEVLFIGAEITPIMGGNFYNVTYNFLVAKTQPPSYVTLANGSSVTVSAGPWDYVWYQFEKAENTDGTLKQGIQSIHVARVYETSNFDFLGLHP